MKRALLATLAATTLLASAAAANAEDDLGIRLRNYSMNPMGALGPITAIARSSAMQMYQKRIEMRIMCAASMTPGVGETCKKNLEDFDKALEQVFFNKAP